jgi:hypothetical protein
MTQERRTFTYTPVSQSYVVPSYREFRAGVHAYENGANKALGRGY